MKTLFAFVRKIAHSAFVRVDALWRSTSSSVAGGIAVATGLFTNAVNADALHALGLESALVHKIGAALIVLGALGITPKDRKAPPS